MNLRTCLVCTGLLVVSLMLMCESTYASIPSVVSQSQRNIPVIAAVDVVVVGGTTAGVAAARSATDNGARAFLVAPRTHLGEDICATSRLELGEEPALDTHLERKLFTPGATPAHIKGTLVEFLLEGNVPWMYGSNVTDVLRDHGGQPSGVVIANRAGRQAIVAKVIIDATEYAWVCRMGGCASVPWTGGDVTFERTVLLPRGNMKTADRMTDKPAPIAFIRKCQTLDIKVPDWSFASLATAEQVARDRTFDSSQIGASERLFCVPPNPILCEKSEADFRPDSPTLLGHLQPKGHERFYVLNGCANVPRAKAAEWLRAGGMIRIATEVGRAAAIQGMTLPVPKDVRVPGSSGVGVTAGDVHELLSGARSADQNLPTVHSEGSFVPVLAEVDVVVVGGGTAGAPAAIAAAQRGLKTLVIEYHDGLGGIGTVGLIGKPYHGNRTGFAAEVPFPRNIEQKLEWYRTELRKAGGTIWFGALGCGAFVEGNTVKGAVVSTPEGRGVVLAKVVIDATGNADVAISAGADYMYGTVEKGDIALQGTGLPVRYPGSFYQNTDYLLVDEADQTDVWRAHATVQLRKRTEFDVGSLIQSRERRRVLGDFVMRYIDQISERTYSDSAVFSGSDYDSHGYPSSVYFALLPHDEESRAANHPAPGGTCFTPYRCLLPRGLDGILVAGLGISMDRDATAMVRMQLDMANQGYAAGIASWMAVRDGVQPRNINVRELQRHLVDIGALPETALIHEESFPLAEEIVAKAIAEYGEAQKPDEAGKALGIILTHPDKAYPLLCRAHGDAEGPARLMYAKVLAVLGDKEAAPELVAALNAVEAWDPKILQGAMADHAHLPTPVDSIIVALGHAGERSAVPAILRMMDMLDARATLSHHRTVAMALERLGDKAGAEPLAGLLRKPGMQGYALTSLPKTGDPENRSESLREITLARALYRLGDHDGLGEKILRQYQDDYRGLFARHARAVLNEG